MARGPLPKPNARRRNAPTIKTTELPAAGRKGRAPKCPYDLAKAGSAWWAWAWKTPQAAKWDDGALYHVARRARLEDELAVLGAAESRDVHEVLGMDETEATRELDFLIRLLKSHASGSVGVMREMRELDNRLGLNAKAMADLRWSIAQPEESEQKEPAQVRRLRAVDPAAG